MFLAMNFIFVSWSEWYLQSYGIKSIVEWVWNEKKWLCVSSLFDFFPNFVRWGREQFGIYSLPHRGVGGWSKA